MEHAAFHGLSSDCWQDKKEPQGQRWLPPTDISSYTSQKEYREDPLSMKTILKTETSASPAEVVTQTKPRYW